MGVKNYETRKQNNCKCKQFKQYTSTSGNTSNRHHTTSNLFTLKTIDGVRCCLIGNKCYKLQRVETSPYIKVKTDLSDCYHLTITADQMQTLDSGKVCEHIINGTSNKTARVTRHTSNKGLESYLFNAIDQIKNASNFYEISKEEEQQIIDHFEGVEELEQISELRKNPAFKLMQAYKILSGLYEEEKTRKQAEEQARKEQLIQQEYNGIVEQFKRFNVSYNEQDILNTIRAKYISE